MSPPLHPTYPRITHRQNCGVFPSQLPRPIRQIHKRRHHGRPHNRRGSLKPHSNPVRNAGRRSISHHPNTLPHLSKVTAGTPTAPALKASRPAPEVLVQPDCPTLSPRVPKLTPTALPPRVTIVPSTHIPDNPPPKPVSITPAGTSTRGSKPVPTHLQPCTRTAPYNRWQGSTQPCYIAALSHLLQREEQANAIINPASGQALEYQHLIRGPNGNTWIKAPANDLGRLAQGVGTCMPTGTNTVFFVAKPAIPHGPKFTYDLMVTSI